LDREGGRCTGGHDHFHVPGEQLRDEGGEAFVVPLRPSILDDDVLPFDIAPLAQTLA
jgi:hypothetical protein